MNKSIKESTIAFFKTRGHNHDGKNSTKVDFSQYSRDDLIQLKLALDAIGDEKGADEVISGGGSVNELNINNSIDPPRNIELSTGVIYDKRERIYVDVTWDAPAVREGYYDEYYFDYYYPGDYGFNVTEYEVAIVKEDDPDYDYRTRTTETHIRFYDIDPETSYRFYVTAIDSLNNQSLSINDVIVSDLSFGGVNMDNDNDFFFNYEFLTNIDEFSYENGPDGSITTMYWDDTFGEGSLGVDWGVSSGGNRVCGYISDDILYPVEVGMKISSGFQALFFSEEGTKIVSEAIFYDEDQQELEIVDLASVLIADGFPTVSLISLSSSSDEVPIVEAGTAFVSFRLKIIGQTDLLGGSANINYYYANLSANVKGLVDAERTQIDFDYAKSSYIAGGLSRHAVGYNTETTSSTTEKTVLTANDVKLQKGRAYKITFNCHRFNFSATGAFFSVRLYAGSTLFWTNLFNSDEDKVTPIIGFYNPVADETVDVSFKMARTSGTGTCSAVAGSGEPGMFLLIEDIGAA